MARFLSPEWVAALNEAATVVALPHDVTFAVAHVVGDVTYLLEVADGRVHASLGTVDGADVRLLLDYETAAAIARGELTAEQAVAAGRLKLAGNVDALVRNASTLAALADVFAAVRDATIY